ncbi:hypothetical protein [Klebsiella michiganensis]|uniref:hypothetical protein n=1 Tax=Klebsiella michiganensis TaxID=1134687 RepID=UPI0016661EA0|nr:hypothetical protein [Klebsiella michiganensis]MBD0980796.1 hypothetical protein [Klebsiella michiganensis]
MNIETVNELIQSLESAGELSIKETKVMALAKAYQQLVAENVALNEKLDKLALWPGIEFYSSSWQFNNNDGNEAIEFMCDIETPATDRIVAGIKADEAKFIFQSILDNPAVADLGSLVDWLEQHANDSAAAVRAMREGADK